MLTRKEKARASSMASLWRLERATMTCSLATSCWRTSNSVGACSFCRSFYMMPVTIHPSPSPAPFCLLR